ncbi:MAG: type II secretion system protein [Patescibacteria group bacterium]
MNSVDMIKISRDKGFTLIELLVVVSIISFLSSVIFSTLNNARVKARDSARIQDMHQMQLALELYRSANGTYPVGGWLYSYDASWNTLQTALTPYMKTLPKDPKNSAIDPWWTGNYTYAYYFGGASSYDLVTQLEDQNNKYRCELKQWMFYNAGSSWCSIGYSNYIYTGHQ